MEFTSLRFECGIRSRSLFSKVPQEHRGFTIHDRHWPGTNAFHHHCNSENWCRDRRVWFVLEPRRTVSPRATLQPVRNSNGPGKPPTFKVAGISFPSLLPDFRAWSIVTDNLVRLSTFVFVFLLVPQLIQNGISMAAGDCNALSILSWKAYGMGMLGNTLLLSYFLDREEGSAAVVQVVGIVSNAIMLLQIFMAGFMPQQAFLCSAVITSFTAIVSACKASGVLSFGRGQEVWRVWQDFLGVVGAAVVLQAMWSTFIPRDTLLPLAVGFSVAATFLVLDRLEKLPGSLTGLWSRVPALSATLLFGFQPLPQLAKNIGDPSSLAGVNSGSLLLGMLGNGLMAPRALFIGDIIWLTSSSWACTTSWAQLLTLFLGRSSTGARYLPEVAFIPLTLALLAYVSVVLKCNANAKGLLTPWASTRYLLTGTLDEVPSSER
eukprot:jgi/Botrbrau1/21020/Bobra.0144s0033.1